MNSLRDIVAVLSIVGLGAGYFGSQASFFQGRAAEWARRVDQPTVQWLALGFTVVLVVLALLPDRASPPSES
ncbi:MAG: hypothetical protein SNJ74_02330 [Fimbriimonadaceae bacterium]